MPLVRPSFWQSWFLINAAMSRHENTIAAPSLPLFELRQTCTTQSLMSIIGINRTRPCRQTALLPRTDAHRPVPLSSLRLSSFIKITLLTSRGP